MSNATKRRVWGVWDNSLNRWFSIPLRARTLHEAQEEARPMNDAVGQGRYTARAAAKE